MGTVGLESMTDTCVHDERQDALHLQIVRWMAVTELSPLEVQSSWRSATDAAPLNRAKHLLLVLLGGTITRNFEEINSMCIWM